MRFWQRFAADRTAAAALCILAVVFLLALSADWITPFDTAHPDLLDSRLPPLSRGQTGAMFWLGSDEQGRDMLTAILLGLRISLIVGVSSALLAGVFGTLVGLDAAEAAGWREAVLMRIVDLQLAIPAILVALMIVAASGKSVLHVTLALVVVEWARFARTARAAAASELGQDYVSAARCLGLSRWHLILRHLLPNCLSPLIVLATTQIARAIALEATLSFLGLGVPQGTPSLGLLIAQGERFMLSGRYWMSFYPGLALLITMFAINLIGDRLRGMLHRDAQENAA